MGRWRSIGAERTGSGLIFEVRRAATSAVGGDGGADVLADGLSVWTGAHGIEGEVRPGFDVFGVTHGGYLTALCAHALIRHTGLSDILSVTTHFLRKAREGPIRFDVQAAGFSRRFTSVAFTARQAEDVVLAGTGLLGDREAHEGPRWERDVPFDPTGLRWTPHPAEAGADMPFPLPNVALPTGMRLDLSTVAFVSGEKAEDARIRALMDCAPDDRLAPLVACDLTPPVVWNVLGMGGWIPTLELTAHVRARPSSGPLRIEAVTRHVSGGFLEEDARVWDSEGTLVVQSRQLARAPAR